MPGDASTEAVGGGDGAERGLRWGAKKSEQMIYGKPKPRYLGFMTGSNLRLDGLDRPPETSRKSE
jgi:hypothetical protein